MSRRTHLFLMLSAVIAAVAMAGGPQHRSRVEGLGVPGAGYGQYRVRLGLVDLVPERGLHAVAAARGEPFLIQLREVPDAAARSRFEEEGIELLRYVGGRSYVARCEGDCGAGLVSLPIRATTDLLPTMKLAPVFETDRDLRARLRASSPLRVVVRFFPWVPWEQARDVLEECGASFTEAGPGYGNRVTATVEERAIRDLLDHGEVGRVEPALPMTGPSLVNANERSRVDQVRGAAEFLGVDGTGTRVGVLDWFPDGIHADFEDRVTPVAVRWGESQHGALVSGCIAGAGTLEPRATGVAPGANLFWTSWVEDPWSAMDRFHDLYGVTIVNNSWNTKPGWWLSTQSWNGDLWAFGYYHEHAAAADALIRDTDLLVVFSAGNKRRISFLGPHHHGSENGSDDGVWHEDLHPPNPDVSSIAGAAVAKNVLTVGGTTKEDEIVYFSSLGPTDDGRVKPDLVAVGLDVLSTAGTDGYEVAGGTSISSPLVAGMAALLTDLSRRRHGRAPSSSVLKALLIHSTRDLGVPGPDFDSGFGMADAGLAARVLDAAVFDDASYRNPARRPGRRMGSAASDGKSTREATMDAEVGDGMHSLVIEGTLDQGQRSTYVLPVTSGSDELRATLVWHDPPGPILVNDLDLKLVAPDGHVVHPFVLDPDRPFAAATRGVNHRDNVEHVRVPDPVAGRWRIVVEGAAVADGPQGLALIASAGEGNRPPERLFEGDLVIDEFFVTGDGSAAESPSPWTVFTDGDPLNFYIEGSVFANADYGDYFGSITLTASVTDAEGGTIVTFSGAGHDAGPGQLGVLFDVGLEIPAGLPVGEYTAHVELVMHNGIRRTADCPFSVETPG